jgi:hypothetical protein
MPYKDKEQQREYLRRNYEERKAYVQQAKNVPCADCGESYPFYVMDFDHLEDKVANINRIRWTKGLDKIKAEIAKCEVVCANCHRIRTYNRQQAPLVE